MKSNILLALIFLAMVICSHAIQVRETTAMNRRHRRHRSARSLSGSKSRAMMKGELWDAIKDIFNKEDFRFSLGGTLTLQEAIEFPYSITLFSNENGEWDWTYSPKGDSEVNEAAKGVKPDDLKSLLSKYTDGTTLAQLIYDAAEDAALSYIKDLVAKVAKAILVAIFPPIAPIFAIWCLINESGVYARKDEEKSVGGKIIYDVGYSYELGNKYGITVTLMVQITLNFGKIKALIDSWKEKLVQFLKEQYEKFVPKAIRDVIGAAAKGIATIAADCAKMAGQLYEGYLQAKKIVIQKLSEFLNAVKNSKVGQWVVKGVAALAEAAQWVINKAMESWKKFTTFLSNLGGKVVENLKKAYESAKDWTKKAASKVVGWFKSWWYRRVSYRRIFRVANRRYFRSLRRFSRSHSHLKH